MEIESRQFSAYDNDSVIKSELIGILYSLQENRIPHGSSFDGIISWLEWEHRQDLPDFAVPDFPVPDFRKIICEPESDWLRRKVQRNVLKSVRGIPEPLRWLILLLFSRLPNYIAEEYPIEVLESIRPGTNLLNGLGEFLHWLIADPDFGITQHVSDVQKEILEAIAALHLTQEARADDLSNMDLYSRYPKTGSSRKVILKDTMAKQWKVLLEKLFQELNITFEPTARAALQAAISSGLYYSRTNFDFENRANDIYNGNDVAQFSLEVDIRNTVTFAAQTHAWAEIRSAFPKSWPIEAWTYKWVDIGQKAIPKAYISQRFKLLEILTSKHKDFFLSSTRDQSPRKAIIFENIYDDYSHENKDGITCPIPIVIEVEYFAGHPPNVVKYSIKSEKKLIREINQEEIIHFINMKLDPI